MRPKITLKMPLNDAGIDANTDDKLRISYLKSDETLDVWLHGAVGDEFTETDSGSIGRILRQNSRMPVNFRVNSPGGLAYDGVAMFNALQSHDGKTTGIIEGMAGSAASLAVLGCDEVHMHAGAVFHPHYSLIVAFGHQAQIRDALAVQEQLDNDLEQLYSSVSGRTITQVKDDLEGPNGDGTRFGAQSALDAGYVSRIIKTTGPKASADDELKRRQVAKAKLAVLQLMPQN
jgi:ATP-dependent Clp protease protease subunit